MGTAYIDPLWWGVEQLFVLKRLFGQFVPEMALKFGLGVFAIHASLSLSRNPNSYASPSKSPFDLVNHPFISKRWNLPDILLASLRSAAAIGAFLALFDRVGTFCILRALRCVADAAHHGRRRRYGAVNEAGAVNYVARRYTASGFFCSYNCPSS